MWSSHIHTRNDCQPELQLRMWRWRWKTEQLDANRSHNMTKLNNSTFIYLRRASCSEVCTAFPTLCRRHKLCPMWRQASMWARGIIIMLGEHATRMRRRIYIFWNKVWEGSWVRAANSPPIEANCTIFRFSAVFFLDKKLKLNAFNRCSRRLKS